MQGPAAYTQSVRVGHQTHTQTQKHNAALVAFFLIKSGRAAPPPLGADMRARNVLMLREVFDAWRHETFRHWPPHATDLISLQDHFDVWHAWMQWVRLATGLGRARARRMGLMLRTNLCAMLGCDWLGLRGASWRQGLGLRQN